MALPQLSQRRIIAYNRLSQEVGALNCFTRMTKPTGTLGERSRRELNRALRLANRIYGREAGIPKFRLIDPIDPLSMADLLLLVSRLTTAGMTFEARYAHLGAVAHMPQPAQYGPSGLPAPRR